MLIRIDDIRSLHISNGSNFTEFFSHEQKCFTMVTGLCWNVAIIPCTFYTLHTTLSSSRDTREVSSSHCGALGFIVSMFSLQSFCFEALLVYELKVYSFITTLQHSQISSLVNNSTRFKSSMHGSFVFASTHEDL
jgi:hypothetical protein